MPYKANAPSHCPTDSPGPDRQPRPRPTAPAQTDRKGVGIILYDVLCNVDPITEKREYSHADYNFDKTNKHT